MSNPPNNPEDPNAPFTFTVAHQEDFNKMINTIIELQNRVKELTEKPTTKVVDFTVREPETFIGKRHQLSCFLGQCQMVFDAQPNKFPSDFSKILYISSHFRDSAFSWIQPYIGPKKKSAPFMQTYNKFIEELERTFGEPDIKNNISRQLDKLYQTSSAVNYSTEFLKLSSMLNWDDEALSYHYYRGLKEEVKDQMTHHPKPKDFFDLIQISIDADNRIYERVIERNRNFPRYNQNNHYSSKQNSNINAMEIDGTSTKKSPISNEERKRRIENNLCLYCASAEHSRINCAARIAAEQHVKKFVSATTNSTRESKNYQTQYQ